MQHLLTIAHLPHVPSQLLDGVVNKVRAPAGRDTQLSGNTGLLHPAELHHAGRCRCCLKVCAAGQLVRFCKPLCCGCWGWHCLGRAECRTLCDIQRLRTVLKSSVMSTVICRSLGLTARLTRQRCVCVCQPGLWFGAACNCSMHTIVCICLLQHACCGKLLIVATGVGGVMALA